MRGLVCAMLAASSALAGGCLLPDVDPADWDADGTPDAADCAPADPARNGRDDDGDGSSTCGGDCDDADPARDALDQDGDGVSTCDGDCDDWEARAAPGHEEGCDGLDSNCDGDTPADEIDADVDGAPHCADCDDQDGDAWLVDSDGDGFDACSDPPDCLEGNPSAFPGGTDPWIDDIDQNCDGVDGIDADGDGHASNANTDSAAWDCDDGEPAIFHGADEVCDGLDSDCDGATGDGEEDADGDGFAGCEGWVDHGSALDGGGDCDDAQPAVNPGAEEVACDGLDTDCDGDLAALEQDGDGDGWLACEGFVDRGTGLQGGGDCDDISALVSPGAAEACDGLDSDCSGEGVPADEQDVDADGWVVCFPWGGDVSVDGGGDCDDAHAEVNPGAAEDSCDGVDTDCDGAALAAGEADGDSDGWLACAGYAEHGAGLAGGGDCDDAQSAVNPGETEHWCDGVDTDCDGAPLAAAETDSDGDGWLSCPLYEEHGGGFSGARDCDEGRSSVHPGAFEDCDGLDTDCGGSELSPGETDPDGDGWLACEAYVDRGAGWLGGGDCWPGIAEMYPGAAEVCDGLDDDCDLAVDPSETDPDGDQWLGCSDYVDRGGGWLGGDDCEPDRVQAHPGALEVACNGIDDDCHTLLPGGEADIDGDGWLECSPYAETGGGFQGGGDCDDWEPDANPGTGWDDPADLLDADCGAGTATWLGRADATLDGVAEDAWAGYSVAGVGDVDGDGLGDVAVGAIGGYYDTGTVYVVFGATLATTGGIDLALADVVVEGNSVGDSLGFAVAPAGDLDGDGFADVLIGATGVGGTGRVYLLWGSTLAGGGLFDVEDEATSWIEAEGPSDLFGWAISAAGDVSGDGVADVLVGAPGSDLAAVDAGAAFLIDGSALLVGGPVFAADALMTLTGEAAADEAGHAVAIVPSAGGGDGADLLVGAPRSNRAGVDSGAAYLAWDDSPTWQGLSDAQVVIEGADSDDRAGSAVGSADVDDDGFPEILVGAPGSDLRTLHAGAVFLLYDADVADALVTLAGVDSVLLGEEVADWAGTSLAGDGDVDGDGHDDLLIGAPTSDRGGIDGGAAWLVLGSGVVPHAATELETAEAIFAGDADDEAGWSVAFAGDLDGDGRDDLVIGAPTADTAAPDAGRVHVLLSPW